MKNIEQYISPFIESQFPEFYREEGPLFILFTKEYFKWLEAYYGYLNLTSTANFNVGDTVTQGESTAVILSVDGNNILVSDVSGLFVCKENCDDIIPITSSNGGSTFIETISTTNFLYQSRNLNTIRDIDRTTDYFLKLFKEKYLKNVQLSTETYRKTLIKAAHDLFKTKGTERSIDFLFKLVFGTPAKTYYPGQDILNLSDGKWEIPKYLELTRSSRTKNFIGREITGSYSKAKAFVEYIITRNIKGKLIDIAYLSNVRGEFTRGDIITENGIFAGAPFVVGSLTDVIMTARGRDFEVGEIVTLTSNEGQSAKARIVSILSQTGIVEFEILDSGWGFTTNAEFVVSSKVLVVDNKTNIDATINNFSFDERIVQPLTSATLNNISEFYTIGDKVNYQLPSSSYSLLFPDTSGYRALETANSVSELSFTSASQDFSIESFVKLNVSSTNHFFNFGPSTDSLALLGTLIARLNGSALLLFYGTGGGSAPLINQNFGTNSLYDDEWHHLSIQWKSSEQKIHIYLDGEFKVSNTLFGVTTWGGSITIGSAFAQTNSFKGYIAGFKVSNTFVYSGSTYTVPNTALTVDENTVLLTAASDDFIDISDNEIALTKVNDFDISTEHFIPIQTSNAYVLAVNTNSTNSGTIILSTTDTIGTNSSVIVDDRKYLTVDTSNTFSIGENLEQSGQNTATTISSIESNSVLLAITPGTTSSNGLHVGQFVLQTVTGATGVIRAIDTTADFDYSNVNYIVVSNTFGTFSATNSLNVYPTSANLTLESVAVPNTVTDVQILTVDNITGSDAFVAGNTVAGESSLNEAVILLVSDVGGKFSSQIDLTASGLVMGVNATAVGVIEVNNQFYITEGNFVYGDQSNTYGNVSFVSTGSGAGANVGVLDDSETVRVTTDLLSGNNDGPGSANTPWMSILVSGANAGYGSITSVYIENAGTGYSNGNVLVFSGGAPSAGAANAVVVTDSSGAITAAAITDGGLGYTSSANVVIKVSNTNSSDAAGTGGSIKSCYSLGFPKLPAGDLNYVILDLLSYESLTIGSISSLVNINPGTGYNADPFVRIVEPTIASYNKKDFILEIDNLNGRGFIVNEVVSQIFEQSGTEITAENLSGNSAMEVGEYVYTSDGISNAASGIIKTYADNSGELTIQVIDVSGTFQNTVSTITLTGTSTNTNFSPGDLIEEGATANGTLVTSNTTALVIKDVVGTFSSSGTVTSNGGGSATFSGKTSGKAFELRSLTSNTTSDVTNVEATLSNAIAKARVKAGSTPSTLYLRRISLFTDFQPTNSNNLIGSTSGSNCSIVSVSIDGNSKSAGYNANVAANVVTTTGAIDQIDVFDSGFGYIPFETVTIASQRTPFVASGIANVFYTGTAQGRYKNTDGFLDNDKFIFDGEYYQGYSYEVQSKIPFDDYAEILKSVLHVAGTRFYGKFAIDSLANTNMNVANSYITIT